MTFLLGNAAVYGLETSLPDPSDPIAGMGVNIHFTDAQPGELEMLSRAGFRWIRMDLTWSETEKTPGVYDFSAYDRLMASLDKLHLRPLLILDYTNVLYDNGEPSHTDEGRAAFARWAVAATTHFKDRGVLWEIWNEPNGGWFWKPKPNADDYAKLALTVSQAIRKATPGERIVGPALNGTKLDFVEVLAKAGVLADWSGITIHPYLHGGPESYGSAYDATRQLIKKYALPGQQLNVMCGESGYSSVEGELDEEAQGKYLARLFLFDVMSEVPLTIWYDWREDGENPRDRESNFGIVRHDYLAGAADVFDPKPAYYAAQTYSLQLVGYRFSKKIKTDSPADIVLSFTDNTSECLVAWTTAPITHQVKIPARVGTYAVTDYDGKIQTALTNSDGTITLRLNGGPQYLKLR